MGYNSAHGWFYTYYYDADYLKKNGGVENIRNQLEQAHINNIKNTIKAKLPLVSQSDLAKIQTDLNNRINVQNHHMKELLRVAKVNKSKYANAALIEIVKKLGSIDDVTAQKIVDKLYWDEAAGALQYGGTDTFGLSSSRNVLANWKPGKAENYRIASYALERINNFIQLLDNNFSKEQIKSVKPMIDDLKLIRTEIKKHSAVKTKADKVSGQIPLSFKHIINQQEYDIAEAIWTNITQIKNALSGIDDINMRLSWIYSELVGNLAGATATPYSKQALGKAISSWAKDLNSSSGTTHTGVKNQDSFIDAQITLLDQNFLKNIYKEAEQEAIANNKRIAETYIQKIKKEIPTDQAQFHLKSQVSAQGKADAELSIILNNGQQLSTGMSFKNYNMDKGGTIALQDSGFLLNYLADSPTKRFMEHILNIYSKHGSKDLVAAQQLESLLPVAQKSLYASLLFSAMTGYNQGREGREASLLILYNKNQKPGEVPEIVKVYSMQQIIFDIIDKNDYGTIKVSPKFNIPLFENTWEDDLPSAKENANLRNTKVLYEARQTNVSVSLAKRFLT